MFFLFLRIASSSWINEENKQELKDLKAKRDTLSNEVPIQLNLENHEGYSDTILTHLSCYPTQAYTSKL